VAEKDQSGTPLWKKLGLKPGITWFVGSAPYPPVGAELGDLIDEFPPARHPRGADMVLLFTTSRKWLSDAFPAMAGVMADHGAVWVAWPKKSSKLNAELKNDLDLEAVKRIALGAEMAEDESSSISEDWQAFRFARRRQGRKAGDN
jgi:hypothetical protein